MNQSDIKKINKIVDAYNRDPDYAIEMMQDIQDKWGYLPEEEIRYLADEIKVPLAQLYHIATFFDSFKLQSDGKTDIAKLAELPEIRLISSPGQILLRNVGAVDPKTIKSYMKIGGYKALGKALKMSRDDVIKQVRESGLCGRGGCGVTAQIWQMCIGESQKSARPPFIICNAFDFSPRTYPHRTLLEMNPHAIIEGTIITAYALGAKQGFIYLNNENKTALERVSKAIEQAYKNNVLGEKILGSDFNFDLKIRRGCEAYISGMSKAIVVAMSGHAPEPTSSNIHVSQKGYKNAPTVVNNAETLSNIPLIIEKGADWFSKIGSGTSGTKLISLSGDIVNPGLVEVPFGTPLEDIIVDYGGGIVNHRKLKAIQVGGPSGGFLPENMLITPLAHDELSKAGTMLGSGELRVIDERNSITGEIANVVGFLKKESCGKCAPCRDGLAVLHDILNKIVDKKGSEHDLETLKSIATTMQKASLCDFGIHAAIPILSGLRHFKNEFIACLKGK